MDLDFGGPRVARHLLLRLRYAIDQLDSAGFPASDASRPMAHRTLALRSDGAPSAGLSALALWHSLATLPPSESAPGRTPLRGARPSGRAPSEQAAGTTREAARTALM